MAQSKKKLSKDIIDSWPEVFEEVKFNVLPLKYIQTVNVTFTDNSIWEIKLTKKIRDQGWEEFEKVLAETIMHYENSIENIDFKLDTDKVKKDIKKKTQKFLKNKLI